MQASERKGHKNNSIPKVDNTSTYVNLLVFFLMVSLPYSIESELQARIHCAAVDV